MFTNSVDMGLFSLRHADDMRKPKPPPGAWLADRLDELADRGKSRAGLARALGLPAARVSEMISGIRRPAAAEAPVIAAYLEWPEGRVLARIRGVEEAAPSMTEVRVRGHVQAGDWREAYEWDRADWYAVSLSPDPRYPGIERFALEVRGNSMDQLYPDRSIILCVRYVDLERWPELGERIVVLRRNRLGEVEATVKELHADREGRLWLWPRSFAPEHQQPIPLPWSREDWEEHIGDTETPLPKRASAGRGAGDGTEEIFVLAKVVGSYRPE